MSAGCGRMNTGAVQVRADNGMIVCPYGSTDRALASGARDRGSTPLRGIFFNNILDF